MQKLVPGPEGEKVLIVEDDRSLREGLALNLMRSGYEVVAAKDGTEGLRMAFDEAPDLVLLDIMLPGMSGLETPVLVLSARDQMPQKLEGFSLGADDYLTKPFDLREVLARIDALLRGAGWRGPRRSPRLRASSTCSPFWSATRARSTPASASCVSSGATTTRARRARWTTSWPRSGRRSRATRRTRASWSRCGRWGTGSIRDSAGSGGYASAALRPRSGAKAGARFSGP